MLDYFAILTTGGVVLFQDCPTSIPEDEQQSLLSQVMRTIINEGTFLKGSTERGPLKLEWTFHRDLSLIFIVLGQGYGGGRSPHTYLPVGCLSKNPATNLCGLAAGTGKSICRETVWGEPSETSICAPGGFS